MLPERKTPIFPLTVQCSPMWDVAHAERTGDGTAVGSVVTHTCPEGFYFPDRMKKRSVYCKQSGTWSDKPVPCQGRFVYSVANPEGYICDI